MITQIKRHQTFWITTNLPRKTKVPFSKVIIRHFFRLHVSRVYRGFALHLCFTFYEACTKLALVFYNLSGTASVSRELPPLYFLSIFSNYKHPPPLPCNKTVGLAIVGSGWAAWGWISNLWNGFPGQGEPPQAIFPPSTTISVNTYQHNNTFPLCWTKSKRRKVNNMDTTYSKGHFLLCISFCLFHCLRDKGWEILVTAQLSLGQRGWENTKLEYFT